MNMDLVLPATLSPVYLVLAAAVVAMALGVLLGFLWGRQAGQERLLSAGFHAAEERLALTAELAATRQREETLMQQNETLSDRLKLWFENTATRVLRDTSEQSQRQLDGLLAPVKERLEGFQKRVDEVYGKEAEQRTILKTQIDQLYQANCALTDGADALARALKGDPQKRGQWGEMILDNVLRTSGLKEGVDYTSQGRGLGLKGDGGEHQKPDVIVRLAGGRQVVVDAKVQLVSYVNWVSLDADAPERDTSRRAFVDAVRAHIKELSGKRYQDNGKLMAHEYVLMFIPIESALAAVLDADTDLTAFAWNRRVALVGPTTLLLTLNIINTALQLERQERNATDIAREAAALYDQIRLVAESLNEMDRHFASARDAQQEAVKRLATGRGNVLARVESFRARGLAVKNPVPRLKMDKMDVDTDVERDDGRVPEPPESAGATEATGTTGATGATGSAETTDQDTARFPENTV